MAAKNIVANIENSNYRKVVQNPGKEYTK